MEPIIPKPQQYKRHTGYFRTAIPFNVIVPSGRRRSCHDFPDLSACFHKQADPCISAVQSFYIVHDASSLRASPVFSAGERARVEKRGPEAYALKIESRGIGVIAGGRIGAYYAVQTLRQLAQVRNRKAGELFFPCVTITDWPSHAFRGVIFDARDNATNAVRPEYIRSIIDRMSQYKLNKLMWYDEWSSIKLDCAPELASGSALTKDEVRALIAYAAQRHIEIVPVFNSFGHWPEAMRIAHADLSEAGQGNNFCPSNPRVYDFLERLIAEIGSLFPSRLFLGGCDEVTDLGICPRCKRIGVERSWVQHVNRLNAIVKKQGKTLAVWTDFIDRHWREKPERRRVLDQLDPDIILQYWYYSPWDGPPNLKAMIEHSRGRPVEMMSAVCTTKRVFPVYQIVLGNIEDYIRFFKRYPAIRNQSAGLTTCVWLTLGRWFEQSWFGILYHADLAWNDAHIDQHDYMRRFDRVFLGVETDDISKAILELSACNVFDHSSGANDRIVMSSLFIDILDPILHQITKTEALALIATIPPRIARIRKVLSRWKPHVQRNRLFFEDLEVAADRFAFYASRFLRLESACEHYRKATIAQWTSYWAIDHAEPRNRREVVRRLSLAIKDLQSIHKAVSPLKRKISRQWLKCMRRPGLDYFHLSRLNSYARDVTSAMNELRAILKQYQAGAALPPADQRYIFKSSTQYESKYYGDW